LPWWPPFLLQVDPSEIEAAEEAVELLLSRLPCSRHSAVLRLRFGLEPCSSGEGGGGGSSSSTTSVGGRGSAVAVAAASSRGGRNEGLLDFTSLGKQLGVGRAQAQKLYHAAIASARQVAAAGVW